MKSRFYLQSFDKTLFLVPILIFVIGLFYLYSASWKTHVPLDESLVFKQVIWMIIGLILILALIRLDYHYLADWNWVIYIGILILLIAVLFSPSRAGAHRWFDLGWFNLQPSELAKISVILSLASYFAGHRFEYSSKRHILISYLIVLLPMFLIFIEPDLGTSLIFVPVLFAMLYTWGLPARTIFLSLLPGIALSPFLFHMLKDYQRARLLVFINPNLDPLGVGYTIIQSKIAIGSGRLFGKGLLAGTQNQLHFLPENHTDFIFAVVGEEGGFLACVTALILLLVIIQRGFAIAGETPDRFGRYLAVGCASLLTIEGFINAGMTLGLLPVVGMPFPLISYGGSSLINTLILIGLLINIRLRKPTF